MWSMIPAYFDLLDLMFGFLMPKTFTYVSLYPVGASFLKLQVVIVQEILVRLDSVQKALVMLDLVPKAIFDITNSKMRVK